MTFCVFYARKCPWNFEKILPQNARNVKKNFKKILTFFWLNVKKNFKKFWVSAAMSSGDLNFNSHFEIALSKGYNNLSFGKGGNMKNDNKKTLTKEQLIDSLIELNSNNVEWNKHFTKARLQRGFTLGMLTYLLNNQITKKEVI